MKTNITHRERLETAISGGRPDRPPVALWRHFPVDDQKPHRLADAHIHFQKTYDFDFLKVTPESTYMSKEWGGTDVWTGSTEGTRDYDIRGIRSLEDWKKLSPLPPTTGRLADQVKALRMITSALGPHTPVLETIFSPMTTARKLSGESELLAYIRQHPGVVHDALKAITETTLDFIAEIKKTGIAGVFFAMQFAQFSLLTEDEFATFCLPYNRQVLEAASDLWLNVVHLHGTKIMFDQAITLPAQVINWHDLETPPTLAEGQQKFKGVVCGGLRQWETMAYGDPEGVKTEASEALEATGGTRFILGTGCVTPIITPHSNLMAARRSVEPA